jgi:hypothetical protein
MFRNACAKPFAENVFTREPKTAMAIRSSLDSDYGSLYSFRYLSLAKLGVPRVCTSCLVSPIALPFCLPQRGEAVRCSELR